MARFWQQPSKRGIWRNIGGDRYDIYEEKEKETPGFGYATVSRDGVKALRATPMLDYDDVDSFATAVGLQRVVPSGGGAGTDDQTALEVPVTVAYIGNLIGQDPNMQGVIDHIDSMDATNVPAVITSFNNNLSAADDTVQKALDTIDDLALGGSLAAPVTWAAGTGYPVGTIIQYSNAQRGMEWIFMVAVNIALSNADPFAAGNEYLSGNLVILNRDRIQPGFNQGVSRSTAGTFIMGTQDVASFQYTDGGAPVGVGKTINISSLLTTSYEEQAFVRYDTAFHLTITVANVFANPLTVTVNSGTFADGTNSKILNSAGGSYTFHISSGLWHVTIP